MRVHRQNTHTNNKQSLTYHVCFFTICYNYTVFDETITVNAQIYIYEVKLEKYSGEPKIAVK